MKITIVDDEGNTLKKRMVGTEEGFQALLDKYQVSWLVNDDGFEVTLFEDLQEGTYTLGDKIAETIDLELQQQAPASVSYYVSVFDFEILVILPVSSIIWAGWY